MVNKNSVTPLYKQIVNELRKEILCNQYGESGNMGTHTQMAERFGVSLITIRKAVQVLEEEGVVETHQGKGTFVRHSSFVDPLQDLKGASTFLSAMDVETVNQVPVLETRKTPIWLPKDVRSALGPECLFVMRVIKVGSEPISCTEMYLPIRFASYIRREDLEHRTVYQVYESDAGIRLGKGKQVIRANGAHGNAAEQLHLPENWPILEISRKAYDDQEELIEYMILSYEASRYSFMVELQLHSGKQA